MIVDTHAHLDMLNGDPGEAVRRAEAAGVVRVITIVDAARPHGRALGIVNDFDQVYFAAGVHPHDAREWGPALEERLLEVLTHTKALMVGEIGLDYFRMHSPRDRQIAAFRAQLDLARRLRKPVSIHVRDAYDDALAVLREYPELHGSCVLHCYSSDFETATSFLEIGCYVSIAGPVTYPRSDALREVAASVPLDRLVVETDCPFLTPQAKRGSKNEPAFVSYVVDEIVRVRSEGREAIERALLENTLRLVRSDLGLAR